MARESAPEIGTERLLLRGLSERDFPVYERFFCDAEASELWWAVGAGNGVAQAGG